MFKPAAVLIGLSSILFVSVSYAQVFDGNLTLTTQAEVEAFNYLEVTGSLTVEGDGVENLDLPTLESVGSYLSISDNTALVTVGGFDNLTGVGGGIYVYYNPQMATFSGFDSLLQTGDNMDFWYNDSLVSVSGFSALQTVDWSLEFGGNPLLMSIPDFGSLTTIASSLFILDNNSLNKISGFNALDYVDWSFQIIGNPSLDNLCGFYDYFSANNPYTGGGAFNIDTNGAGLPDPTTMQDVIDGGPCGIGSIDSLILVIEGMGLSNRVTNSLVGSLTKAKKSLERGRVSNALRQLTAMIKNIQSFEQRGKIGSEDAGNLTDAVVAIIDEIS